MDKIYPDNMTNLSAKSAQLKKKKSRVTVGVAAQRRERALQPFVFTDNRSDTKTSVNSAEFNTLNEPGRQTTQLKAATPLIQRVARDDLTDRDQKILLRTLTGGTLSAEQSASYLEIVKSLGGRLREATDLSAALHQMTVAEFGRFYIQAKNLSATQAQEREVITGHNLRTLRTVRSVSAPRGRGETEKLPPVTGVVKKPLAINGNTATGSGLRATRAINTLFTAAKEKTSDKTAPPTGTGRKTLLSVGNGVRGPIRAVHPQGERPVPSGNSRGGSIRLVRTTRSVSTTPGDRKSEKTSLTDASRTTLPHLSGGQVARLEQAGVEPLGAMPWTHNSTAGGLLGILTTGQFLPAVEDNVNFRYDLDSRYHDGVSMVMRPQMEWCWDGSHVQDLYHQSEHLRGARVSDDGGRRVYTKRPQQAASTDHHDPRLAVMREHLGAMAKASDFRDTQIAKIDAKGKLPKRKTGKGVNPNYALSVVNPQLRIPGNQPIGFSHIDFIIITKEVDTLLKQWQQLIGLKEVETGVKKFIARQKTQHNRSLPTNVQNGLLRLEILRKQGNVLVVPGTAGCDYSHKAGRLATRSVKDDEAIRKSAAQGMEIHEDYFVPETNNSHAALNLETFLQFQEAYYKKLAGKEGHRAQEIAREILKRRAEQSGKGKVQGDEEKVPEKQPSAPLSPDEKLTADREFDELVMSNNCLPHAILGRQLTLEEARQLRITLLDQRQAIGDYLDADQPVIEAIVRQFAVSGYIVINEGSRIRRRFRIEGDEVLDVTGQDREQPLPSTGCLRITRVGGNHFIRK
ncbi:MAG: hypothetical protein XXXJIFNMEKO3_02251 [Candidatus Erwinia impunctatus]|nr:hypothetical protein XXXJIFNMEKO_02251 [Culicoides impunctatus]